MELKDSGEERHGPSTAPISLEISAEVAERAERLLGDFAEDAGLETALIVDRSGALVAGISAEEDVAVEVIADLVAGASSAMKVLAAQFGDTGEIESLHQGGKRLVYLREVGRGFLLVGVANLSVLPGLLRAKASRLRPDFVDLLSEVEPLDVEPPVRTQRRSKSLRAVAAERAAARIKVETVKVVPAEAEDRAEPGNRPESAEPKGPDEPESEETGQSSERGADPEEMAFTSVEDEANDEPGPDLEVPEDIEEKEPVEVHEPLDLGEPEIVIENSVAARNFSKERAGPEDGRSTEPDFSQVPADPSESIFELEEEEEDPSAATAEPSIFELEEEAEEPEEEPDEETVEAADAEGDRRESTSAEAETGEEEGVFEFDDAEEDEQAAKSEEKSEVRSGGPFYF